MVQDSDISISSQPTSAHSKPQAAPRTRANWNKSPADLSVDDSTAQRKVAAHSPQPKRDQKLDNNKAWGNYNIAQSETKDQPPEYSYLGEEEKSQQLVDEQNILDEYEQEQTYYPPPVIEDREQQKEFEIYQMYEEMLQLVKDGLDTPSKELIEGRGEERKGADSDDDEGFNDDRDEDFVKETQNNELLNQRVEEDKKAANKKFGNLSPNKRNLKQRFEDTLSTVQEEMEPENTFANTHAQKGQDRIDSISQVNVEQEDDRDDFDDESTEVSAANSEQSALVSAANNKINKDFTFAQGAGGEDLYS